MGIKITKTTVDGVVVYTEATTTLLDDLITGATGAFGIFSPDETIFHSASVVAKTSLVNMAAGFFVGDRFGDSVPFLGQGRK